MKTIIDSSEIISYIIKNYAGTQHSIHLSVDKIYQIA